MALSLLCSSLSLDAADLSLDLFHLLLGQGIEVHGNNVAQPANDGQQDKAADGKQPMVAQKMPSEYGVRVSGRASLKPTME